MRQRNIKNEAVITNGPIILTLISMTLFGLILIAIFKIKMALAIILIFGVLNALGILALIFVSDYKNRQINKLSQFDK